MSLPNVTINQSNGNLGIVAQSDDSASGIIVSGVAVGGQFALGDVLGPFTSIEEVEAKGIDAAYDVANTCLAHKQISDFYSVAPRGTKLYVMVVAKTVTMTQMCDQTLTHLRKLIETPQTSRPRVVMVSRVPDGGYTPTYATQLDNDLIGAIANAKALIATLQSQYMYPVILLEGRDWQGNVSSTLDLRDVATSPGANRVAVVLGNDYQFSSVQVSGVRQKYAFVGLIGGKLASVPVSRNIARTEDGPTAILSPGFANGAAFSSVTPAQLGLLNDKGYIFLRNFEGMAGYYINFDHTAVKATDDYNNLRYARVIDKASLIAYRTFIQRLNSEVEVDTTTGKMLPSVIKSLEGEVETNIAQEMSGEINGVDAYIDADQDVLATSTINVELTIVPYGNVTHLNVTLGLRNPNIA